MVPKKLKNIIEGFIFASDKVLSVDQLIKMFPEGERPDKNDVEQALQALQSDFESHGIELKQVSSGYRFQVREEHTAWVSRLWEERPQKYTRALLETLALIVYRQPITRGEIEEIRGVSVSTNIIRTLQEREWIKVVGQRDVPGRPTLFASTKQFLDYFNLESLEDLPPLSEIKDLDAIATELDPEQNAALLDAIRKMQDEQGKVLNENPSQPIENRAESVETIALEIENVLDDENKLDIAEDALETALLEQTSNDEKNN